MRSKNFIQVYEHQRLTIDDDRFSQRQLDALLRLNEFHEGTYFEPIARGIKFNQYVGILQVDQLTIEILPKADKDDEDVRWQKVLIQMLEKCGRLKPQSEGAAHVNRQHLNLLEIYFEMFLHEVNTLIHQGLVKQYRKETSNVKALKGKLEFAGNIRNNLVHKERFYTTHQVYDTHHLLHQTLAYALEIVEQFSRSTPLYDACKRTRLHFPYFEKSKVTSQQLKSLQLNRKSKSYAYALELARLIILNYSPDISSGNEKMLSLLFDMNELWEEYVLTMVRKACEGTGIEVVGQDSKTFWSSNSLRPDIVLKKDNSTYIIDTKWKRPGNSSASVSDLRQMYTYCRFWDAEKAMLLYPGTDSNRSFKSFETEDYYRMSEEIKIIDHQCKMAFVEVVSEDGNSLEEKMGDKILEMLFA